MTHGIYNLGIKIKICVFHLKPSLQFSAPWYTQRKVREQYQNFYRRILVTQTVVGIMVYAVHAQLWLLCYDFHPCCAEKSSSNVLRKEFPGANPICLPLLFLLFTAITVTVLSILLRGEGVTYSFSSHDFITNVKISFCRVREITNEKVFIAFPNDTALS